MGHSNNTRGAFFRVADGQAVRLTDKAKQARQVDASTQNFIQQASDRFGDHRHLVARDLGSPGHHKG